MEAMSAASAFAFVRTSSRSSFRPAPPDAMTGMFTCVATLCVSSSS